MHSPNLARGSVPTSGTPLEKRKRLVIGLFKIALMVCLLFVAAAGVFFAAKFYTLQKKVTIQTASTEKSSPAPSLAQKVNKFTRPSVKNLRGQKKERINILLTGMTGEGYAGKGLTDTVMIASIQPDTSRVAFISLPRDLYVQIPQTQSYTKLNSVFNIGKKQNCELKNENACGVGLLKETVTYITGLDIHYFLIVNYDGFEKVVNSVGGINVTVERDIYDPRYPGPGYSYETFKLEKGFHHLDGATALKYARERHSDPDGDFGRARRQQQIIKAVKNRVFSTKVFFNAFALTNLLNSLGDTIVTDIVWEEYPSFIELTKKINIENAANVVVDAWEKDSLLKVSHVTTPQGQVMFILIPRVNNYSNIQELAHNVFDMKTLERKKEEISREEPNITFVTTRDTVTFNWKIKKMLQENISYPNLNFVHASEMATPPQTVIYDFSGGSKPFSLDDLIKKFDARLETDRTPLESVTKARAALGKNDIIIIGGQKLVEYLQYEEDSIEDLQKSELDNEML